MKNNKLVDKKKLDLQDYTPNILPFIRSLISINYCHYELIEEQHVVTRFKLRIGLELISEITGALRQLIINASIFAWLNFVKWSSWKWIIIYTGHCYLDFLFDCCLIVRISFLDYASSELSGKLDEFNKKASLDILPMLNLQYFTYISNCERKPNPTICKEWGRNTNA